MDKYCFSNDIMVNIILPRQYLIILRFCFCFNTLFNVGRLYLIFTTIINDSNITLDISFMLITTNPGTLVLLCKDIEQKKSAKSQSFFVIGIQTHSRVHNFNDTRTHTTSCISFVTIHSQSFSSLAAIKYTFESLAKCGDEYL